jgi:hypothetical protein
MIPDARLTECYYCGKYSVVLMDHGPGRCIPPLGDAERLADIIDITPTPVTPLWRCTCGKVVADADGWGAHNRTLGDQRGHRLITGCIA